MLNSRAAPSKKGCPAVPTAPPGANVNQNMAKAKIQGIFNPLAPLWFYNQVNYGGAMDYKTQGAQYEDFGILTTVPQAQQRMLPPSLCLGLRDGRNEVTLALLSSVVIPAVCPEWS